MDNPPPAEEPGLSVVVRPKKKPAKSPQRKGVPRHNVVLWDDDDHSYEYVMRMLRELFGHPAPKCLDLAKTVDTAGRVVVLTTTLEHAELKRDQIHAYGRDEGIKGCKGSMSASIEAAG